LNTLKIFAEACKLWSYSLCSIPRLLQRIRPGPRPCVTLRNKPFFLHG